MRVVRRKLTVSRWQHQLWLVAVAVLMLNAGCYSWQTIRPADVPNIRGAVDGRPLSDEQYVTLRVRTEDGEWQQSQRRDPWADDLVHRVRLEDIEEAQILQRDVVRTSVAYGVFASLPIIPFILILFGR